MSTLQADVEASLARVRAVMGFVATTRHHRVDYHSAKIACVGSRMHDISVGLNRMLAAQTQSSTLQGGCLVRPDLECAGQRQSQRISQFCAGTSPA